MPIESDLNVTPEVFEKQIRGLKTKGWKALTDFEVIRDIFKPVPHKEMWELPFSFFLAKGFL